MFYITVRFILPYVQRDIKAGRFSSRDEVFIWNILYQLYQDPTLGRDENVPGSYKPSNKYMKKWLHSSDLVCFTVPFAISSRLSCKQPLKDAFGYD